MAIDWSQEQSIPNTFLGGYANFTPDRNGCIIGSVQGQGDPTSRELAWAYVGDSVVALWASGGNFIYDSNTIQNYYANMDGSVSLPVAAGNTFTLGAFLGSDNQSNPYIYFWWVPEAAAALAAGSRDQAAQGEKARKLAESTRPSASKRG